MNAVGIDISRGKSMVAVLRTFGEVVMLPFELGHSNAELTALAEQLKSIEGETRVVMEHKVRYYEPVANTLHNFGLFVMLFFTHHLPTKIFVIFLIFLLTFYL